MSLIDKIKELCNQANSEYIFSHNTMLDENKQSQYKQMSDKFVWLEERKSGYFTAKYQLKKVTNFVLYICTMIDGQIQDTADDREIVRETMQSEFIVPFIKLFMESELLPTSESGIVSMPFDEPLPIFDNYAVVEILQIKCEEPLC